MSIAVVGKIDKTDMRRITLHILDSHLRELFYAGTTREARLNYPYALATRCNVLWSHYWADFLEKRGGQAGTTRYIWNNLRPHFAALRIGEIGHQQVKSYIRKRKSGLIGKPSQDPTIRRELVSLQAAFNWCADPKRKLLRPEDAPCFELPPAGRPRDLWLRPNEVKRLLAAAAMHTRRPNPDNRGGPRRLGRAELFLWLALETAARKSAIIELSWDRVDFETQIIDFEVPGRRKTKKRRVAVPISTALRPVLERAYGERINNLVLDNGGEVWALVQNVALKARLGRANSPSAVGGKPRATGISPNVLRHTAATMMARRGVPLWKIAKILGNSMEMIERVYAKHDQDDIRSAINQISNGWGSEADLGVLSPSAPRKTLDG